MFNFGIIQNALFTVSSLLSICFCLCWSLSSWARCLWLSSALWLAYTVRMWCCSSYWGKCLSPSHKARFHLIGLWYDERLLSASHHAESCDHLFADYPLAPSPLSKHTLVLLTGSVPICLSRYLIPCNHIMLSQRRVVRERDCYSVSAAKILALTPSCCSPEHSPPPLRQLDSILFSKGPEASANSDSTGGMDQTFCVSKSQQVLL